MDKAVTLATWELMKNSKWPKCATVGECETGSWWIHTV